MLIRRVSPLFAALLTTLALRPLAYAGGGISKLAPASIQLQNAHPSAVSIPPLSPVASAQTILPAEAARPSAAQATTQLETGVQTSALVLSAKNSPPSAESAAQASRNIFEGSRTRNATSNPTPSGATLAERRAASRLLPARARKPLQGRKLILLGTKPNREWMLKSVLTYAERTGLEAYLVDIEENRNATRGLIDDAHFLSADILNHDPTTMNSVASRIESFARQVGFTSKDRIRTYLNPVVELNGQMVDKLGVFGNSYATVRAAHTKSVARDIFAKDPELAIAYETINETAPQNAREAAADIEKLRRAFRRVSASGSSGKVVLKPIHGGGSALVIVDVDTEEKAVAAWTEINAGLLDQDRTNRKFEMLDHYPGIMMEYQFDGVEVDIEMIRGPKGDAAIMMDNPPMDPPYAVEKGLTGPSQLPKELQRKGVRIASRALDAVGYKAGNAHVELKYSPTDKRWYILEINARMGGGPVMPLVKSVTGVNLISEDLNAHFGLPAFKNLSAAPKVVGESRFIIPKITGRVVSARGLEEAARMPGIVMADWFKRIGDLIQAAPDNMFDYFGMVNALGKNYDEAFNRLSAALHAVEFTIRAEDGRVVTQSAAHAQEKVDVRALLKGGKG